MKRLGGNVADTHIRYLIPDIRYLICNHQYHPSPFFRLGDFKFSRYLINCIFCGEITGQDFVTSQYVLQGSPEARIRKEVSVYSSMRSRGKPALASTLFCNYDTQTITAQGFVVIPTEHAKRNGECERRNPPGTWLSHRRLLCS